MSDDGAATIWTPVLRTDRGPLYLAIAEALAADIARGALPEGTRLPPQRTLAETLGIDFTTVTRAYAEARRRGLVEGKVGQGTFVRAQRAPEAPQPGDGLIDMSMNAPPRFDDAALAARMRDALGEAARGMTATDGLDLLLRYQEPGGTARDRATGLAWLSRRIDGLTPERVLLAAGAQGAVFAIAGTLAGPGDTICTEALTYPGFRSQAAFLRIELVGVAMDEGGVLPEAFEAACRTARPKAFYCTPTLHNPTTATLSLERREALVAIARRYQVPIIEDDAYGALPIRPIPPLAALAPELVFHVAGLSKCLAPALRVAYLVVPDHRHAQRITGAIRATASTTSPLTAALATRWIEDGTADGILGAIRRETAARQALAARLLPAGLMQTDPEAFHLWLRLPETWSRGEFAARLRLAGISAVGSDAFALGSAPEAIRLGLGPGTRPALERSLRTIGDLLAASSAMSSMIV